MIVVRNNTSGQIVSFYPKRLDLDSITLINEASEEETSLNFDAEVVYNKYQIKTDFFLKAYNFYLFIVLDSQNKEIFRDKLFVLDENGNTGTDNHFEVSHEQNQSEKYMTL